MTCWDLLGISPTNDRQRIEAAYEQQKKFAAGTELEGIEQAYREALQEAGHGAPAASRRTEAQPSAAPTSTETPDSRESDKSLDASEPSAPMSAEERQVVREVIIQAKAALNDRMRYQDKNVWRAILSDPPADKPSLRNAIGPELKDDIERLHHDDQLPLDTVRFLADWFGWDSLKDRLRIPADDENLAASESDSRSGRYQTAPPGYDESNNQQPQFIKFLPAVVGWIVGLVVLTSLFGMLLGS